ncbi:MAG: ABC transporter substrate-binding protein [Chloroflexota bacterium]|nr:ABC transporter substrate-binding protein [Chloroflexota bacterium]
MPGRFRWLILLPVIALVATACGPSATTSNAPSGASAAPASAGASASAPASSTGASAEPSAVTGASCAASAKVVKFWTSHTPPDSDTLKKIVDAFNAANADICVKMTIVPGSETDVTKLITSIRGGVAPDVYMADRFTVPQRAAEGVLDELPADVAALKDQHVAFAWNETQYKGKTYAIPFDTDARALWYNADLVKAAGQDPSQLDISKGAPTIATVTKIADAISKKDASGNYDIMGWMPGGPGNSGAGAFDQGWHYTWGFDYGGKFADIAACKVTPTDPGVVKGYQFMYDWAKAHDPKAIARWVSTNWAPNAPQQSFPFWTGKLGMTISGDWQIANAVKYGGGKSYKFTYIPVPNAGDKPTTWAGGWSMALIPKSAAKDQAVKFMMYIAGPEGQKVYTKDTTHLPTLIALQKDASLYDAQHKVFLDLLPGALNRPPLAVGGIYWDALTQAQGAVELNTKTPADALAEVATTVQPRLDEVGC